MPIGKKQINSEYNLSIESLKSKIKELEETLNKVANDNGSIIVKQLPNGEIELNGAKIDNTTEVEYYNSSQATYGELTMFRIGKESKQREMDKLIKIHMDEIDKLHEEIQSLESDRMNLNVDLSDYSKQIDELVAIKNSQVEEINKLNNKIIECQTKFDLEKQAIINRYEQTINLLNEDIETWRKRYLNVNNIELNGTIITKYGKVLSE